MESWSVGTLFDDPAGQHWLILGLTMGAVFFLTGAVFLIISNSYNPVRKRLYDLTDATNSGGDKFKERWASWSLAVSPKKEASLSKTRERIVHAGFRSSHHVTFYFGIRAALMLGLPALGFVLAPIIHPGLDLLLMMVILVWLMAVGMVLPSFVLDYLIRKRQRLLRNGLPDVLDMLVVCTEAGLSIDAALQRVAREMEISYPAMAEELQTVNAEIRAGVDRIEALRNLAKRTGLEDIRGLVTTLAQSMHFGTSVAESLRVYAAEFRDKRRQAAEEEAAKLPIKILFPLITCFIPGFFIVTVGPAILSIQSVFSNLGN